MSPHSDDYLSLDLAAVNYAVISAVLTSQAFVGENKAGVFGQLDGIFNEPQIGRAHV